MAPFGMFRKTSPSPKVSLPETALFAALSPFRVEPRFVARVWGFTDLTPWYDVAHLADPVGEVWLTGDDCRIATGAHTGKTLAQLFAESPEPLLGKGVPASGSPLLIKVIFAREKLSVQVHPDDWLAQKIGQPRGKTECWYALAAEPGAQVAAGLKPGVTLDQVRGAIADGSLEKDLRALTVEPGDMIFVDAGTVHAIWPGSILLETQQNSDITYRLFDYGRPRELHVDKGLEAIRLATRAGKVAPRVLPDRIILVDEDYFRVERLPVAVSRASTSLAADDETDRGLAYLFAANGSGRLTSPSFESVDLPPHGIVAIPAASPVFAVQDLGGLDLIRISPRWPER